MNKNHYEANFYTRELCSVTHKLCGLCRKSLQLTYTPNVVTIQQSESIITVCQKISLQCVYFNLFCHIYEGFYTVVTTRNTTTTLPKTACFRNIILGRIL